MATNNYEQALNAVQADPDLLQQLLDADSQDEKKAVLTAAGVPVPTESECNDYMADHPEDAEQMGVEGTAQFAMETGMCCL